MSDERFRRLEEVVTDPLFAEIDIGLRRGRHVNGHDIEHYGFLRDAQAYLEDFYRQYDCELRHASDGYFHLVPNGDRLGRGRLSGAEMLVGQVLALFYLDPQTVSAGGVLKNSQVVQRLEALVGKDRLIAEFRGRQKRNVERVDEEGVRRTIGSAVRKLGELGFVVYSMDEQQIRLCPPSFASPSRCGHSRTGPRLWNGWLPKARSRLTASMVTPTSWRTRRETSQGFATRPRQLARGVLRTL